MLDEIRRHPQRQSLCRTDGSLGIGTVGQNPPKVGDVHDFREPSAIGIPLHLDPQLRGLRHGVKNTVSGMTRQSCEPGA